MFRPERSLAATLKFLDLVWLIRRLHINLNQRVLLRAFPDDPLLPAESYPKEGD